MTDGKITPIEIQGKKIGPNHPCFVIAEAGSNHNGDLRTAYRLIDIAAAAKADAVKFQTVTFESLFRDRGDKKLRKAVDQISMPLPWHNKLKAYAERRGIIFLTTPVYEAAVDYLDSLKIGAYKIASLDLNNLPFLGHVANKGRTVLLSTGLSDLSEVEEALRVIRENGNPPVGLFQCTSSYPTKPEDVHLNAMVSMQQRFRVPIGLSDHTLGIAVAIGAAALGANMVEKHFTYSRKVKGFDHFYAVEPDKLAEMTAGVHEVEKAIGSREKKLLACERDVQAVARRSIVAAADIRRGTKLVRHMLSCKRPADGLPPTMIESLIGKKALRDIRRDELVAANDIG